MKTYPCVLGFLSNQLRFSFIRDSWKLSAAQELTKCLREYGKSMRNASKYTSFETSEDMFENYIIEDYRNLFWSILNNVTSFDGKDWTEKIPSNPSQQQ